MSTALIIHGGGPTAVVNASLAGIVEECRRHREVTALHGARFGMTGLLGGELTNLFAQSPSRLRAIAEAPGSVLGSTRMDLDSSDFDRAVKELQTRDVRWLFCVGGNGTMEMALKLARLAPWLRVIGIPKTADNDLAATDHSPGYLSAARFAAFAARDIGEDNRSLPAPITLMETIGRNTGWVVAATSLARYYDGDAPHLIYFPEHPVSADRIAGEVEQVYRRLGRAVIAVCEGQRDERGKPFGAEELDSSNPRRRLPANLGFSLARLISDRLGVRARAEKPGLLGRSCAAYTSDRDRLEAWRCGEEAVRAAIAGRTGMMVALRHDGSLFLTPLESVARRERPLPREWIQPSGNDVRRDFLEWLRPLAGDVPPLPRLA